MLNEPCAWRSEIRGRAEQQARSRIARWSRLGYDAANLAAGAETLPLVTLLLATRRAENIESCRHYIAAQVYPRLEVIVVLNSDAYDETQVRETFAGLPLSHVLRRPESSNLGACINLGVAHASGDYVAKIDDDDFYAPSYVSDLALSALETGADIVGKKATFCCFDSRDYVLRGAEYRNRWLWPLTRSEMRSRFAKALGKYASTVAGATLLVKREVVTEFKFDEIAPRGTDTLFQVACRRAGMTTYGADEFNFCYMRNSNAEGHLWQATKVEIAKKALRLSTFDRGDVCA